MAAADADKFREIRNELFADAYPDAENLNISENQVLSDISNNSGLGDYAFTNEREFWAKVTELYFSGEDGAEILKGASPELYAILDRYYSQPKAKAALFRTRVTPMPSVVSAV